jgi:hypothetical protein
VIGIYILFNKNDKTIFTKERNNDKCF